MKARTMNLRLLTLTLVAGALGYSGSTLADDITIDPFPFVPSASRAEVRSELDAFKKSGVNPWKMSYNPLRTFRSSTTRAEATAEYIRERDAVAAMNGEDSGSRYLAEQRDAAASVTSVANGRSGNLQQ
ncbi:MAG TPA: hypothetical protein VIU02_01395 [Burkholderiales bacterium]